jgi:hypothetical protein
LRQCGYEQGRKSYALRHEGNGNEMLKKGNAEERETFTFGQ